MRRRLDLVAFSVTVPFERQRPQFAQTLLEKRGGILGWRVSRTRLDNIEPRDNATLRIAINIDRLQALDSGRKT